MVVNRTSDCSVIVVPASMAVAPFFYRASLKFDKLGRLVITG